MAGPRPKKTDRRKPDPLKVSGTQKAAIGRLAKLIALHCVRNTFIEDLHAGKSPSTQTGDFSDVKVVTPFGEIPWPEVSRISDQEMKRFNKEVVNKLFTVLLYLEKNQEIPVGSSGFYSPHNWDDPEIDAAIAQVFEYMPDTEASK